MQPKIENINKAIAVMERVHLKYPDKFHMWTFQHSSYKKFNEEDFVNCGTSCCFSGWLSIAPEFKDYPDKEQSVSFVIKNHDDDESLAELLGIDVQLACDIIYYNTNNTELWDRYNIGHDGKNIKPTHIVDILMRIRDGELK
jgi:hypothetical protein